MNPNDVEISKGIVTNPHRLGGEPTVKGTRITAQMVARLLDVGGTDGMDPTAIIDSYPSLTYTDLSNVKAWATRP